MNVQNLDRVKERNLENDIFKASAEFDRKIYIAFRESQKFP